jgi:hypothetical protein
MSRSFILEIFGTWLKTLLLIMLVAILSLLSTGTLELIISSRFFLTPGSNRGILFAGMSRASPDLLITHWTQLYNLNDSWLGNSFSHVHLIQA